MRLWVFILPFWCGFSTQLLATDLYVNNVTGSDRRDGMSPQVVGNLVGPFRTINQALRAANQGDRVILAATGEPYRESITLQAGRNSGTPRVPFELIGNGAVLDGTRPIPVTGWAHYDGDVFRYRPPKSHFQLLYLEQQPAKRIEVTQVKQLRALKPRQWCLYDRYIYFRAEPGRLPQSYDIAYTALEVGITLYEVRYVTIHKLVVQGFQLDGVNAHDGVFFATLVGMTCRGNGRSGISIGGASRVRVESCLVGNNGAAQVRTEGFSHTQLIHCDLLDTTAPKLVRDGGEVEVEE